MAVWRITLSLLPVLILKLATAQEDIMCSIGLRQSPIDIETDELVRKNYKRDLCWKEGDSSLQIRNTGLRPQVYYKGEVPTLKNGPLNNDYEFLQAHFHWGSSDNEGSDHSINGKYAAAEYHARYLNKKYENELEGRQHVDGLVELAILFKLSTKDNPDLDYVLDGVRRVSTDPAGDFQPLDARALDFAFDAYSRTQYYTYEGSLARTPCSEAFTWIVMKEQIPISAEQIDIFRETIDNGGNNVVSQRRSVQPLNGRTVYHPANCCCN